MNEKLLAFRVGVVVLAAACLAALLIVIFGGGQSVLQRRYTVFLSFPQAPGVTVDTPIRKNGVLIGRVSDVELFDDHVLLTARIDANRKLRNSEIPRISRASLIGDSVLEFVPSGDAGAATTFINDGDTIANGVVGTDPLQVLTSLEAEMKGAIGSIKSAADEVTLLAGGLNRTFGSNDQQLQRILSKTELALDTFNVTMGTLDEVIGDPQIKADLKRALADLPVMFDDIQKTMSQARDAMASFERVGTKAEQNLDNLSEFTTPLARVSDQLVADLSRAAQNLDEVLSQFAAFGEAINSSDGTLGKLIKDDRLYEDAREAVYNINEASRRLRPIMDNIRVASDKIATDPGGVLKRAVLDGTPSGIGRKWTDQGIPLSPGR